MNKVRWCNRDSVEGPYLSHWNIFIQRWNVPFKLNTSCRKQIRSQSFSVSWNIFVYSGTNHWNIKNEQMKSLKIFTFLSIIAFVFNSCDLVKEEEEIAPYENRKSSEMPYILDQQEIEKSKGSTNPLFSNIGFGPSEVAVMETDSIN